MSKYLLIRELINLVEAFEREHSSHSIEDFTIWLNQSLFSSKKKHDHPDHDTLLIPYKLMHLNKALKKQTKRVLLESSVSSIDEFSFLLHLDHQGSYRKMEIIEIHKLEAPTGIEIIKRLLKNQFIEEYPDPQDRRAKRIKITKKGLKELQAVKPKIDNIFSGFTDKINLNAKIHLSGLLDKLMD